jgi:hypothetical protein
MLTESFLQSRLVVGWLRRLLTERPNPPMRFHHENIPHIIYGTKLPTSQRKPQMYRQQQRKVLSFIQIESVYERLRRIAYSKALAGFLLL